MLWGTVQICGVQTRVTMHITRQELNNLLSGKDIQIQ